MSEILQIFFRLPKSASAGQWGLGHLTGYRGKKWPFWARRCEIWPKNHFPWKLELIFCPKKVFGGTPNTLWWWCQFPRVNIDQPHQQIKTKVWAKPKPFNFRDLASSLIDWVGNILILILGIDHWSVSGGLLFPSYLSQNLWVLDVVHGHRQREKGKGEASWL